MDYVTENKRLNKLLDDLMRENLELQKKVIFFESYGKMANGIKGETLIARLVDGEINDVHKGGYDVKSRNNKKVEVKFSLVRFNPHNKNYKHWQWNNILGHNNNKRYDYIILIAEVDDENRDSYKDKSSPYIFFVLTWEEVCDLVSHLKVKTITVSTNQNQTGKNTRKNGYANLFFNNYQRTADEISKLFVFE